MLVPLLYLAAITIAEAATLWNMYLGIVLHSIVLVVLIFHGAATRQTPRRRLLLALTLAPLIRILSVSLPLASLSLTYWYMSIGSLLFIAAFLVARITGMKANRLGFVVKSWWTELAISLIGIALGFTEFFILNPKPLIERLDWSTFFIPAFSLLIFTGVLEELIFRGIIQDAANVTMGRFGLVFSATLFAMLHMGYRSVIDVFFVFMVGLIFGVIVSRTHSIVGVSLAHGLTNIGLYMIFPFLFAGLVKPTSSSLPQEILMPRAEIPHYQGVYSTATPNTFILTQTACTPPQGWVIYNVAEGETWEELGQLFALDAVELQAANCGKGDKALQAGQTIFVPGPTSGTVTPTP
jgi:uncharacterized protein